jgi:hypothetical protein
VDSPSTKLRTFAMRRFRTRMQKKGVDEGHMATTQVILYFDTPADALRFTLAASSALAGDGKKPAAHDLSSEIKRATRIRAEAVTVAAAK